MKHDLTAPKGSDLGAYCLKYSTLFRQSTLYTLVYNGRRLKNYMYWLFLHG